MNLRRMILQDDRRIAYTTIITPCNTNKKVNHRKL